MKFTKKVTAIILSLCLMPLNNMPVIASGKPAVTKSITITQGEKKAIKVKGAFIKSKRFKSYNKKIATVNKKGIVTAIKKGKCKIKVTVRYAKSKKAKKFYKKEFKTEVTVKSKKEMATEVPEETAQATEMPKVTETPEVTVTATVMPTPAETPAQN